MVVPLAFLRYISAKELKADCDFFWGFDKKKHDEVLVLLLIFKILGFAFDFYLLKIYKAYVYQKS